MATYQPTEVYIKYSGHQEIKLVRHKGDMNEMITQAKQLIVDMFSRETLKSSLND